MKRFFVIFILLFIIFGCSFNSTKPGATYYGGNGSDITGSISEIQTTSTVQKVGLFKMKTSKQIDGGGTTYLIGLTPMGNCPIWRFDYEGKSYIIVNDNCIIEIKQ